MDRLVVRNYLIWGEGFKFGVYDDTKEIKTVGVGHNLTREDSPQRLFEVGAAYKDVVDGDLNLNKDQIYTLLEQDMTTAIRDAEHLFPGFHSFNNARQTILVDLAFNLGLHKLSRFHNMIKAINSSADDKWDKAADELKNSQWYHQVRDRGPRNVKALRTGILPPIPPLPPFQK